MVNIKTQEFRTIEKYRVTAIKRQSRTAFVNEVKIGDEFYICTKLHGEKTQAGYLAPRVRLYFPDKNKYTKYTTQERMQQIFGFNFDVVVVKDETKDTIIDATNVAQDAVLPHSDVEFGSDAQ